MSGSVEAIQDAWLFLCAMGPQPPGPRHIVIGEHRQFGKRAEERTRRGVGRG
jgi:hypothetical protein